MRRRAGGEWRVGREPGNVIDVLNPLTEDPLTLVKCTRVLVGSAELSRPDLTIASIVSLFLLWKLYGRRFGFGRCASLSSNVFFLLRILLSLKYQAYHTNNEKTYI